MLALSYTIINSVFTDNTVFVFDNGYGCFVWVFSSISLYEESKFVNV